MRSLPIAPIRSFAQWLSGPQYATILVPLKAVTDMEQFALGSVVRPILTAGMRTCCNCNTRLAHGNLRLHLGFDELQSLCEQCFGEIQHLEEARKKEHRQQYQKAYRAANKDKIREYQVNYKEKACQNRVKNQDKIRQRGRAYYRLNRDRLLEQANNRIRKARAIVANDPLSWKEYRLSKLLPAIRGRAKKKNLDFNLTLDYLLSIATDHCPVDGLPMHWEVDTVPGGRQSPRRPSVDRLIPSRGYVQGNVQVICLQYNVWKRDMTLQDMQLLFAYLQEVQP